MMGAFFVGQRVRLARPDSGSRDRGLRVGNEGVIACRCPLVGYRVDFSPLVNPISGNSTFPVFSDEIEPAADQKHEACDEEFKRDLDRILERQGVIA